MISKKVVIVGLVVLVAILAGAYFYFMQPAQLPTQDAQNNVQQLPASNNADQMVLHVVPEESKATYEINEDLRGTPTHVVGSTSNIAGDIAITTSNPQKIQIGEIKINARTFKTDIAMRDENVRKLVLKADESANEFIVFKTTNITGVPAMIAQNTDFPVTITGDITIAGVTKSVTFNGNAKFSDSKVLTINANTTLMYEDFGVFIPNFSFLANVDKSTKLSILLIAK